MVLVGFANKKYCTILSQTVDFPAPPVPVSPMMGIFGFVFFVFVFFKIGVHYPTYSYKSYNLCLNKKAEDIFKIVGC